MDEKVNHWHIGEGVIGTIRLAEPGVHALSLKALKIDRQAGRDFVVAGVRLRKTGSSKLMH